ncbi:MAG: DUF1206 domain-containing protein [Bacteroidota bacterium]|nr:DUF1206 domain-containing protein [Bacteroidota bacterium]
MNGRKNIKKIIHYLPVYGCIATGIIYFAVGVIAILSFLRIKHGGADESSLMEYLNDFLVGNILVWVILLGTVSYIMWRIYESIKDPYNYGKSAMGLAKRGGIALSSIADVLIAFTAIQVKLGTGNIQEDGEPEEQRQLVAGLMQDDWGIWVVIAIGVIICFTAAVQFFYGITRGYKERLDINNFSSTLKSIIHILAWVGYLARGFILGIIGFFFIKAGVVENANHIVNTDKAFDFIGDNVGHLFFILVAIGTICYGLFMFALGAAYDADNDD